MTTSNQPRVPFGLSKGDRVKFSLSDDDEPRYGTIIDILSTQFLIEDDDHMNYITHFRFVLPLLRSAIP